MQVIVIGQNRAEFCIVKKNDKEKHFFMARNQLYKVYPDGLERMTITEYGHKKESDEVVIYCENEIWPYSKRNLDYSREKLLMDIDWHKACVKRGKLDKAYFTQRAGEVWKFLAGGGFAVVLVIGVLIYAFIGGAR